jgi:release factor glutamine methyltransferase
MYAPSDDTFLLAQCARKYRGKWALEIGVGSGAVAESLSANFENVAATDIHLPSLEYCRRRSYNLVLVCCDAASAFGNIKFDLVVANPPYLPDDTKKDVAVHGGPAGVETTTRFIESALPLLSHRGAMLVVVSSRADRSALDAFIETRKLKKRVALEKELFFERLFVLELTF